MKPWRRDTLALRFALTIILTVSVTVGLFRLLISFGGTWALPDIERSGLPRETAGILHAVDAMPPEMRPVIAAATSTRIFRAVWHPKASPASTALDQATTGRDGRKVMAELLGETYQDVKVFTPDDAVSQIPELGEHRALYPQSYFLAVKLPDQSWMVFQTFTRSWGFGKEQRLMILVFFSAISIVTISLIAASQLSRPVKRLAEAVRIFGHNPHAPPLAETGPVELRQVIRTFNAMQAQIQKFIADRTMMLAAISHDLRTPLTRIRLRGEYIEDQDQQERLFRDVDEMQAMVDGALAFFRDDAAEEATTDFDLPGVLQTILNDYADQGIEIGYAGPDHAACQGRPFALKRAFTNLIDNAIKYGKSPEIALSCAPHAFIVTVRDQGPGIPADALEQVFSPFYRLDKSRNRTTGGVGLGLTAAQAILRAHGGDITLANRSEGGLEAIVTLPLPSGAKAPHSGPSISR